MDRLVSLPSTDTDSNIGAALVPMATMILEKDETPVFVGRRAQGLCGLMLAIIAHGADLTGAKLTCHSLTKEMVRLALFAGIRVFAANRVSEGARQMLADQGMPVEKPRLILSNESELSESPEIATVSEALSDTEAFFQEIKKRILRVLDHNMFPTDSNIFLELPNRLNAGGGGT
jgi:hypothetical protein